MFFPLLSFPDIIQEGAKPYEHLFASPESFEHFQRYLTGLMVSDNKSIEGITNIFAQDFDQSSLNRFLTQYNWNEKQLNDERIKNLQTDEKTRTKAKNSVLGIDDTFARKYGNKTPYVGIFYDHKTNGYIKAHNIITSQYTDKNNSFAIEFRLYQKYPKKEKERLKKEAETLDRTSRPALIGRMIDILQFRSKEQTFKTKQEMFRELVDDAIQRNLLFEAIAFDNWYFNQDNVNHIQSHNKNWLGRMKSNTIVLHKAIRTAVRKWAKECKDQGKEFKPYTIKTQKGKIEKGRIKKATYWCYSEIKKVSMLGKQKCRIVVAYNNKELKGKPIFIVTGNLTWDIQHILDLYALRWPIETFYRESKRHLGLEDYQMRSTEGTKRHWYLVFLLDTILGSSCRLSAFSKYVQGRARTIGEQCRAAVNEALKSLICWIYQKMPSYENPELLYEALLGINSP